MTYDSTSTSQEHNSFLCMDCGVDTDEIEHYYMLHRNLWLSINPKGSGMLCLFCVERRLGRGLVKDDFAPVLLNTLKADECPALAMRLNRSVAPDRSTGNRQTATQLYLMFSE